MHLAPLEAHHHCALIVDNERDGAEALRVLLTIHGYDQVRVAESGAEALATLRTEFHPCVIVLDMHMPTMNGLAFLQAKGADRALAAIPVIAVSGTGEEHPVLAGAAAFMHAQADRPRAVAGADVGTLRTRPRRLTVADAVRAAIASAGHADLSRDLQRLGGDGRV